MIGIPTCEQVAARLTDLDEGALGFWSRAGVTLHLALCPPCRAFLRSFRRLPALLRTVLEESAPDAGERALTRALAALREGRLPQGPEHHPEPQVWDILKADQDPLGALLLRFHLGQCGACRAVHGPDAALEPGGQGPLPDTLKTLLPPEHLWRWSTFGLKGGRAARLAYDRPARVALYLTELPPGLTWPAHQHGGLESSVVLSGGLQDGPAHLRPGDWISHQRDTEHAPRADQGGPCWVLARVKGGVRFKGWRRLLPEW